MTYFKSKNNIVGHKYSIQIYCTSYLLLPKWVFQPIHPYVIRRVVIYSSSHLLVGVAHGSVTAEHPTPIADYVRCTANFFVVISLWSTHGFTLNIKVISICVNDINSSCARSYSSGLPPKQMLSVEILCLTTRYIFFAKLLNRLLSLMSMNRLPHNSI